MPNNAGSTKPLRVQSSDFVLTRENGLWLISRRNFYRSCPSFSGLLAQVEELSTFMRDKGLTGDRLTANCTNCDALKALRAQNVLIQNLAKIFLQLYDVGRMDELWRLRDFVSRAKGVQFRRVILAYAGKRKGGQERLVIVG